ncbi:hypothetical protein OIO90_000629 [Microbotryomycetes sp. JL221]|nr:hypothetical protein OIO90_000629 [Microbotryomycetes sp. JL221]
MSFLRKWGSSGPSNNAANTQASETKVEWHNETPGERYYGLENFGNTCYANSVLQSLYFSRPFRELVEAYAPPSFPPPSPSASLPVSFLSTGSQQQQPVPASPSFAQLKTTPSRTSTAPTQLSSPSSSRPSFFGHRRTASTQGTTPSEQTTPTTAEGTNTLASSSSATSFQPLTQVTSQTSFTGVGTPIQNGTLALDRLPAESTLLTTLHDLFVAISSQPKSTGTVAPQAFINQLKKDNEFFRSTLHQDAHEFLNFLVNTIAESLEKEQASSTKASVSVNSGLPNGLDSNSAKTWVHRLFEGVLTNETRCLTCETITSRDEAFLDLSIDIEQNTSVTSCLRQFSASEMLCQRNKFSCDTCCGLQEAEKRMKIKKLPNILALHLKRFKYEESLQRHVKLTYRVVFPFELRLFNTSDHVANPDRLYELWAIVVHIGAGPTHGHYITIVKSGSRWIVFDDMNVYPIEQSDISKFFGDTPGQGSGYVLFYQAVDLDLGGIELPSQKRDRTLTASSVATDPLSNTSQTTGGLGLNLNGQDPAFALTSQTVARQVIDASKPLVSEPASTVPVPVLQHTGASPPALFSGAAALPQVEESGRKGSMSSVDGAAHQQQQKEGSSWAIKSRKVSGVLGRSLSLATGTANNNKESMRSVSGPSSAIPLSDSVEGDENLRRPSQSSLDPSGPASSRSSWTGQTPPVPGTPVDGSAAHRTPPVSTSGFSLSVAPAHPAPPSDDGSASTTSTQGLVPSSAGGFFARRRGSRASVDLSASASTASSNNAPNGSSTLQSPSVASAAATTPAANVASGGGSGALSATRNFLSRKPRPLSTVASTSSVPTTKDLGLGLNGIATGNGTGADKRGLQQSTNQGRPSTAPSSGTTALSSDQPPLPLPNGLVASASGVNGTPATGSPQQAESDHSNGGQALHSTTSVLLTKKELDKKVKEEKKQQAKEDKERAKQMKEEAKRLKQEGKMADKLKRKLSVR